MSTSKKYIFIDFDGTLTADGEYISPVDIEAIHKVQSKGHKVILTTGRTASLVYDFIREIDFDNYILAAGANIFKKYEGEWKSIFSKSIEGQKLDDLVQFLEDTKIPYLLEGEKGVYCAKRDYLTIRNDIYKVDTHPHFEVLFKEIKTLDKIGDDKIGKVSVYTIIEDKYKIVEKEFHNDYIVLPLSAKYFGEYNAEVTQRGINKGSTIKKYCDIFNIDINDTVGIGDSDNDIEMLETVELSIAVGNASSSIKKIATKEVSDVLHGGVAQALYKYVLDQPFEYKAPPKHISSFNIYQEEN